MKPPRRALGNPVPGHVVCLAGVPVSPSRCYGSSYCGLVRAEFRVSLGEASVGGASTNPGT